MRSERFRVFRVPRQRNALSGPLWPGQSHLPAKPSPAPLSAVQVPFSPATLGLKPRHRQPATPPDDLDGRSDEAFCEGARAGGQLEGGPGEEEARQAPEAASPRLRPGKAGPEGRHGQRRRQQARPLERAAPAEH